MRYLPMSFDTQDKTVLVIGGGLMAYDRIKALLDSKFKIYIISEDFIDEIIKLSDTHSERVFLKKGTIDENFVFFNYDYLIIATHSFDLNYALEKRAEKSKIPYERCDIISNSTLLMNKVLSKDDLTIGITTNGVNPTITDIVYEDILKLLDGYNEEKIQILNKIRKELVKRNALNIDKTIRELYNSEKITLNTYLENLKSDLKDREKKAEEIFEDFNKEEAKKENKKDDKSKDTKKNSQEKTKESKNKKED